MAHHSDKPINSNLETREISRSEDVPPPKTPILKFPALTIQKPKPTGA